MRSNPLLVNCKQKIARPTCIYYRPQQLQFEITNNLYPVSALLYTYKRSPFHLLSANLCADLYSNCTSTFQVKTVVADLEDSASLEAAIHGVTAVICTVASPRGRAMNPTMGQYFENLMEAMIKKGVMRLLAVSCISATPEGLESLPFEQKCCIFGNRLKGMSDDMTKFEEFLAKNRKQRLSFIEQYTVIRFLNLVNGRAISKSKVVVNSCIIIVCF